MPTTRFVCWAVAAVTLGPAAVCAQLEIEPRLGAYVPVGALIREPGRTPADGLEKRQIGAGLLGMHVTAWLARRLALDGSIGISPSPVAVTDSGRTADKVAAVVLASARAMVALSRDRSVYVASGIGLVARSGSVWSYARGATVPALVLAAGVHIPLTPHLRMRLEAQDYVSRAQFDHGLPSQTLARTHHDLLWSLGVVVPVAGR